MLPALLFGACLAIIIGTHAITRRRLAFFGGLTLSLLSDVLLLVLIRFTVRWVLVKTSVWRTAVALMLQVGVVYFLVLVPFGIPEAALPEDFRQSPSLQALVVMGGLNLFTAIASSIFIMTLLFVLLHRVTWPILSRLLYPLARYEIMHNHTFLKSVGTACYIFAITPSLIDLKALFQLLAK
jgi:hypothetical protein